LLILCEKPSVALEFAKTLGCTIMPGKGYYRNDGYVITYCVGHLYQLWQPEQYRSEWKKWSLESLPIHPGGEYRYNKSAGTAAQADAVAGLIKAHSGGEILIATDAGREGELIARIALREAGLKDLSRCKRFWVSEALTAEVIRAGIKAARPLSDYDGIAAQGYARQHADWLVGMNLSRFVTLTGGKEKFSVGRVQSAVLAAIVTRNDKVKRFVETPYNELEITLEDSGGTGIRGVLINPESKKTAFALKSPYLYQAMDYAKNHGKNCDLAITVETVRKVERPEKLLNLTALQKTAFRRYGYSPDETLEAAQNLYEKYKCLSYPRTPSRVMGDNNVELFREKYRLLAGAYRRWSQFCVPSLIAVSNRHIFNSAALEDHHALIPLAVLPEGTAEKEKNVYELAVKSFFGVCMGDHIWDEARYTITNGPYVYQAAVKELVEAGWKQAFRDEEKEDGITGSKRADAGSCRITGAAVLDKKTSPPKEFQIDSLLAFMERPQAGEEDAGEGRLTGLGTPATRAEIIKTLFGRGYVREEKKKLTATEKGEWLVRRLRGEGNLAKLADVGETTAWEKQLAEDPAEFEKGIAGYIDACVKTNTAGLARYEREALGRCPLCGSGVYEGKKSFFCSAWNKQPPCKFAVWKETAGAKVSDKDVKLLLAKKSTGIKSCESKSGKKFKASFRLNEAGELQFKFQNGGVRERTKPK
jgi:DNA topoisomerase-3